MKRTNSSLTPIGFDEIWITLRKGLCKPVVEGKADGLQILEMNLRIKRLISGTRGPISVKHCGGSMDGWWSMWRNNLERLWRGDSYFDVDFLALFRCIAVFFGHGSNSTGSRHSLVRKHTVSILGHSYPSSKKLSLKRKTGMVKPKLLHNWVYWRTHRNWATYLQSELRVINAPVTLSFSWEKRWLVAEILSS